MSSNTDFTRFKEEIQRFEEYIQSKKDAQKKPVTNNIKANDRSGFKKELFDFDPNVVSIDSLILLGFSEDQAKVFINFRKSGAFFKTPEDLKKVYVIDNKRYSQLKPYVRISNNRKIIETENNRSNSLIVELNGVDSIGLMSLKGIGPVLSSRVIKYRNLLRGFYSIEQIQEVYGVDKSLYLKIAGNLQVDTSRIDRIDLNSATLHELSDHPYISGYVAKGIVNYRSYKNGLISKRDLLTNGIVDSAIFSRVEKYLK